MKQQTKVRHLAIIMDGNRRWAKKRGLPGFVGHEEGYKTFNAIADYALTRGVSILTVYAFSTENWSRTQKEVGILLSLFERAIKENLESLGAKGVQMRFIGDVSAFPKKLQSLMTDAEKKTRRNTRGILNIAVNYGGRAEMLRGIKKIIDARIPSSRITEDTVKKNLYTHNLPDPDLLIRTSGEQRLSGFLPWQLVYTELYFTPILWPDFSSHDLDEALEEYSIRQRRFGK